MTENLSNDERAASLRRAAKDATEIERLRGVCDDWARKYESWRDACFAAEAERDDLRARLAAVEARIAAQESCGLRDRNHDGCFVADSLRIVRAALATPPAAHVAEVSGEGL